MGIFTPALTLTRLVLAGRTLVDKSRFPTYLAERETKLTFARRETLRALRSLRKDHPRFDPADQVQLPEPLDPENDPRNEPESNPPDNDATVGQAFLPAAGFKLPHKI